MAPAAIAHDPAASRVEAFHDATSVYGPLFTLASYPLALVGVSAGLWILKAVAGVSVLGVALLTGRVARARGVLPATAAAFVALNPLVLVQVVGGAHNDATMMLIALAGVAAIVVAREALGGAALVGAVAVKASAAVLAPFALLGAGRRLRLLAGIVVAAVALAAVTFAVFGSSGFDPLVNLESQRRLSYHGIPATVARITGIASEGVRAAFVVGYGALFAWLVVWTLRGGDWVRAAGWATLGLLVASSSLTPWYLIWALPLVALSRDRVLVAATLALSATQIPAALP